MVRVRPHAFFDRHENDLYCTIPISLAQAGLGTEIKVPTLRGTERLKIPEGTQSGSIFRLRGHGFPSVNGQGPGDLYVSVHVEVPKKLTREQRRMLEALGSTLHVENKPLERRAAEKVRD